MDDIKVSIHCLCYNLEDYIAEALESMLNQKTDFAYEILVHDDASSDRSVEIIRDYAGRYPDKIKLVLQTVNQFTQGVDIFRTHLYPLSKGKYIAICDGDDCWCCEDKLQLQYDFLETHPECILVACNSERIRTDGSKIENVVKTPGSRYLTMREMINKDVSVPQTSSFMFRASYFQHDFPQWFYKTAYDNRFRLSMATLGKVYYIDKVMAKYRMMVKGSYSMAIRRDIARSRQLQQDAIEFFEHYNEFTDFQYAEYINKELARRKVAISIMNEEYRSAIEIYKTEKPKLAVRTRLIMTLGNYFPGILSVMKNMRDKFFST